MADDLEYELDWYHQKVEAGADFAITQPLYDLDQLDRFVSRIPNPPIPTVVIPINSVARGETALIPASASVPRRLRKRISITATAFWTSI